MMFNGTKVVVSPLVDDKPRVTLSPKLVNILNQGGQGAATREFHEWSKKFFGVTPTLYHHKVENTIFVSEAGLDYLKKHLGPALQEEEYQVLSDSLTRKIRL